MPREIWGADMRLFRKAGINSTTINMFSWAKIRPSEHEYYFDELDEIVEMFGRENYDIIFVTSTAALLAWMFKKYSKVVRTDFYGHRHKFGQGIDSVHTQGPFYLWNLYRTLLILRYDLQIR